MNVRRFRSVRSRWHWRFTLPIAIIVILALRCSYSPTYDQLDASRLDVESGTYKLQGITADSRLIILVQPRTAQNLADKSKEPRTQTVKLLAVEIQRPSESKRLLTELVKQVSDVELRFDRRRLTEDNRELQAYAYVDQICLNQELIREGLAKEATHPADAGPMIRLLKRAEAEARDHRRGAWQ